MKHLVFGLFVALCLVAVWQRTTQVGATVKPKAAVTFNKNIAPIFFKSCAECHRPGEAAPFSVMTYKDVRPWAKSIKEKVVSRAMPPWHADPHVGQWANDARLTQAQIDAITAWVDGGALEGAAPDLPPTPQFTAGWKIGPPDLVIPMPETFKLEAKGPDEYQYFEVDPGFKRDTFVQQAEARPGNRSIVHHIIVFIQPPATEPAEPKLSQAEIDKQEQAKISYTEGFLVRTKTDAPVYDDACPLPNGGAGVQRDGKDDAGKIVWLAAYAPGTPPIVCLRARRSRFLLAQSCCFKCITQKRWAANRLTAHPSGWSSPSSRRSRNCWYAPSTTNTSAFRRALPNIAPPPVG